MSANFLYVYDDGRWLILWAVQRVGVDTGRSFTLIGHVFLKTHKMS